MSAGKKSRQNRGVEGDGGRLRRLLWGGTSGQRAFKQIPGWQTLQEEVEKGQVWSENGRNVSVAGEE